MGRRVFQEGGVIKKIGSNVWKDIEVQIRSVRLRGAGGLLALCGWLIPEVQPVIFRQKYCLVNWFLHQNATGGTGSGQPSHDSGG